MVGAIDKRVFEAWEHGNLLFVPFRDLYVDLTLKTISWLEWGVNQARYDYIVKTDDKYCLNTTEMDRLVDGHRGHKLYFGVYETMNVRAGPTAA